MFLEHLATWAPFRIDALGVVTLLGSSNVDMMVGRLTSSPVTDFLPLLGAFKIADDEISEPIPGFQLYNIDDAIIATDISPWFARWLQTQELPWNATYLHIQYKPVTPGRLTRLISASLGFLVLAPLIIMSVLTEDWWGFANGASMLLSVMVRWYVVRTRCQGLRNEFEAVMYEEWAQKLKRVLLSTPSGKMVTIYVPCGLITEAINTDKRVPQPRVDSAVRLLGWLGFGCHIVTLGMANLVDQLITVAILLLSTLLLVRDVGTDKSRVASFLQIDRYDEKRGKMTRSRVYRRLQLSPAEEELLLAWNLFPQRINQDWWTRYREEEGSDLHEGNFITWKKKTGLLQTAKKEHKA